MSVRVVAITFFFFFKRKVRLHMLLASLKHTLTDKRGWKCERRTERAAQKGRESRRRERRRCLLPHPVFILIHLIHYNTRRRMKVSSASVKNLTHGNPACRIKTKSLTDSREKHGLIHITTVETVKRSSASTSLRT